MNVEDLTRTNDPFKQHFILALSLESLRAATIPLRHPHHLRHPHISFYLRVLCDSVVQILQLRITI
jgi:hypothetical protein